MEYNEHTKDAWDSNFSTRTGIIANANFFYHAKKLSSVSQFVLPIKTNVHPLNRRGKSGDQGQAAIHIGL